MLVVVASLLVGVGTAAVVQDDPSDTPVPGNVVLRAPDGLSVETAQWVKDENDKGGTSAWRLSDGQGRGIEGFADAVSAPQGDAVTLYVSTTAASFTVAAYRMGWYGGEGGRLVWRSREVEGVRQPAPLVEPGTGMAEAEWEPSLSVRITPEFPPGAYLFKLSSDDGGEHRIPLVVRDDASTATYLVQSGVMAWQARNAWGARSELVSFDRPYADSDFVRDELPFISMAESIGMDVTYWTDVDLHRRPDLVRRHRSLIALGASGQWTETMCAVADRARVAFAHAGGALRSVRLDHSPLGLYRRQMPDSSPACQAVNAVYAPGSPAESWPDRMSAMAVRL